MKKLNLKELELKLPKIDENYSKILLGGDSYGEYGDRNELNHGPTGPLYDPSDFEILPPMDYDNSYDLDVSIDGYLDNDGNDDGNENGGSNSGSNGSDIPAIPIPPGFTDGINLNNIKLVLELSQGNEIFNSQLTGILKSNSVISNLFENATLGDNSILINIGQLQPGSNPATSTISGNTNASFISQGMQTITLDSDLVTPTGTYDLNYTDNTNLNHGNLTPLESLVAIVAHEMFHAYANLGFYMSQINGNTYEARMNWMLNNGYSQEIVDIYYSVSNTGVVTVNDPSSIPQNEHDYMASSSFTLVNDAIAEFQAEQAEAIEIKENLEALISQAEANLGSGVDPDGGQGSGPTNEQLQETYDNLVHELEDFIHEYGWMLP